MSSLQTTVETMLNAIPGAIAVSLAEIESGMCLASKSKDTSLEPELAAAYNAEVVKQKNKAKQALGLGAQNIEDILITMSSQYHVLTVLPGNLYFIYVTTGRDSNLAIIRNVVRKYVDEILKQIS